jgi:hypothetical protein
MPKLTIAGSALAVAVFSSMLIAQRGAPTPAQAPTGVVGGAVTAADTGQPLRRAQIRLVSPGSPAARLTNTDSNGRFVLTGVAAGEYTVTATKGGYVDMVYGARRPGLTAAGTPIRIADGQRLETLEIKLPRAGAITGTITDEFGDPAFNTAVRVMRFVYSNGERYATTFGQQDFTDDRGSYRISGLLPGEYVVSAVPRDSVSEVGARTDMMRDRMNAALAAGSSNVRAEVLEAMNAPLDPKGYVPVHYPGTVLASGAAPVRVSAAQEVSGIDIRLQVVHTGKVTGTVTWAEGAVPAGARIQLMDPAMPMPTLGSWWTGLAAGSKFVFYGVAPGAYVSRVSTSSAGSDLFAIANVQVNPGDDNEVELRLQRGMSLSGTIATEGTPITLSRLRVLLRPVSLIADPEMGMERVTVDATGRFVIRGLLPARYRLDFEGLPAGWTLASATFGDHDAADMLVDMRPGRNLTGGVIKFTQRTAEISGVATNADGQPIVNAVALMFPESAALWVPQSRRIHAARLSTDGRYSVRGLPPGNYRVVLADPEQGQMHDVEYLTQQLPLATALTLAEGEKRTHDFRAR